VQSFGQATHGNLEAPYTELNGLLTECRPRDNLANRTRYRARKQGAYMLGKPWGGDVLGDIVERLTAVECANQNACIVAGPDQHAAAKAGYCPRSVVSNASKMRASTT
jgi:hypothetical protein